MYKYMILLNIILNFILMPTVAFAHPGHDAAGFVGGFLHPFSGMDHLLAMLAVGMWAAMRHRSLLLTSAIFLGGMLIGGLLGVQMLAPDMLESLVLGTTLLAALLVALAARLPLMVQLALSAAFAVVHGMAHGLEMPGTAGAMPYAAGFLLAGAMLLSAGYLLARKLHERKNQRIAGGVMAVIAGFMMVSA